MFTLSDVCCRSSLKDCVNSNQVTESAVKNDMAMKAEENVGKIQLQGELSEKNQMMPELHQDSVTKVGDNHVAVNNFW